MKRYYTVKEFAALIALCTRSVYARIREGNIKAVDRRRAGGKRPVWRIPAEEAEAYEGERLRK